MAQSEIDTEGFTTLKRAFPDTKSSFAVLDEYIVATGYARTCGTKPKTALSLGGNVPDSNEIFSTRTWISSSFWT